MDRTIAKARAYLDARVDEITLARRAREGGGDESVAPAAHLQARGRRVATRILGGASRPQAQVASALGRDGESRDVRRGLRREQPRVPGGDGAARDDSGRVSPRRQGRAHPISHDEDSARTDAGRRDGARRVRRHPGRRRCRAGNCLEFRISRGDDLTRARLRTTTTISRRWAARDRVVSRGDRARARSPARYRAARRFSSACGASCDAFRTARRARTRTSPSRSARRVRCARSRVRARAIPCRSSSPATECCAVPVHSAAIDGEWSARNSCSRASTLSPCGERASGGAPTMRAGARAARGSRRGAAARARQADRCAR